MGCRKVELCLQLGADSFHIATSRPSPLAGRPTEKHSGKYCGSKVYSQSRKHRLSQWLSRVVCRLGKENSSFKSAMTLAYEKFSMLQSIWQATGVWEWVQRGLD